ncbi:Pentatricopeptide repeat (PPR) superfamily protein [Hibiscus syriacus]|uniref:Pentatricopeptide repeat (PPR) superfamily protein n=1 Tax=Hibiscus syriacus TaxID=106335 RepID=A0A6A3A6W7_HIBSY|nr:Pentatricopeptide repeat (PPR) superfamily protein [Hibiscus syriacus]
MDPSVGRTYLFLPTAHDIWNAVNETYSDLGNAGQWLTCSATMNGVVLRTGLYSRRWWKKNASSNSLSALTRNWMKSEGASLVVNHYQAQEKSSPKSDERRAGGQSCLEATHQIPPSLLPCSRVSHHVATIVGTTEIGQSVSTATSWDTLKPSVGSYTGSQPRIFQPIEILVMQRDSMPSEDASEEPKPASELSAFSKEQLEQLYQLMSSHSISNTPNPSSYIASSSLAQKSTYPTAFIAGSKSNPWIIDSGATDHMTGNSSIFSSYFPLSGNLKDPCSGKMIGNAKEVDGLYHLVTDNPSNKQVQKPRCFTTLSCENEIMLWHYRISQPINSQPRETQVETNLEPPTELRVYSRRMTRPNNVPPVPKVCQPSDSTMVQDFKAFSTRIMDDVLPKSIHEALEVPRWREAVFEELKALKKNDTWDLTPLPEGKQSVGSKWVFTIKYHADGSVERYKARLTKNAFLNGELEEEVFMEVPPGFDELKKDGRVCKLKKSIYGLKQSPRAWFERFTRAVKQHDDIVMTGDDTVELESLKNFLSNQFEVKDLGQLKYFLGMEVARSSKVATPIDPNQKLEKEDGAEPVDKNRYQKLVGKLIYWLIRDQILHLLNHVFEEWKSKSGDLTDADWGGSSTDRRSTTGYCSFVWGNLVTWRSKKQPVVSRSSAEAEFRAMAQGSLSQFSLPVAVPTAKLLPTPSGLGTILSGTNGAGSTSVSGADLYDPDQPLWNSNGLEPSGALSGLRSPKTDETESLQNDDISGCHHGRLRDAVMGRTGISRTRLDTKHKIDLSSLDCLENEIKEEQQAYPSFQGTSSQVKRNISENDGSKIMDSSLKSQTDSLRNSRKPTQKAQCTLFVNGIPQKSNKRGALLSHFCKFGEVIDIYIPLNSQRAFVQFSRREEAEAALKAPDAVMGNRFIKLWWANRDNIPEGGINSGSGTSVTSHGQPTANRGKDNLQHVTQKSNISHGVDVPSLNSSKPLSMNGPMLPPLQKNQEAKGGIVADPAKASTPRSFGAGTSAATPCTMDMADKDMSTENALSHSPKSNQWSQSASVAHPFSVDVLKEHFSQYGDLFSVELEDVENDDDGMVSETINCSVRITYSTHLSAERAFVNGKCWQGNILQFSWLTCSNSSNDPTSEETSSSTPKEPLEADDNFSCSVQEVASDDRESTNSDVKSFVEHTGLAEVSEHSPSTSSMKESPKSKKC